MHMFGSVGCRLHNVNMTPEEQILGVMQIIDNAREVTTTNFPVSIERDKFDDYPDYEPILEKLEWEFNAISINQYPKIDEVDYRASVGFVDDKQLKNDFSYKLTINPKFNEVLNKYIDSAQTKLTETQLILSDNSIVAMFPSGESVHIKKLRTDQGTYNFMQYLFTHQNKDIPLSVIQTEVEGCKSRIDLTELVRNCGFDKTLKSYFFPGTTKRKVHFVSRASIPSDIVSKLQN